MKKKLNETAIINELREGSAFFRKSPSPTVKEPQDTESSSGKKVRKTSKGKKRTDVRTFERTSVRTKSKKKERVKIRHAFDIFKDQLRELRLIQFESVQAGDRKLTLGEMVQEAIDQYLEKAGRGKNR